MASPADDAAQRAARDRRRGLVADRTAISGTPDSVRAEIERQVRELGVNYLGCLFLGTMTLNEALRSAAAVSTK